MILENLEIANFKNYTSANIKFTGKFIFFTGKNGQGKTNILDSIHYLSLTKSFINPIDNSNIRHDENFFRITGNYTKDDNSFHKITCIQERNQKKKITINDKNCDRFANHIGEFPLVVISSFDFDLFLGSEERRKFIDSTISQFDKTYLDNLLQYNRTLAQRNKLLKNIYENQKNASLLEPYNYELEQFATPINKMRTEFIENFIPYFQSYYNEISKTNEIVNIIYNTELNNNTLSELLEKNKERDIALGHTTVGTHREDFIFSLNNYSLKKFGSQGQQKSFLIALKLAKHKYISEKKKNIPILLLDDLHDKLDANRVNHLFEMLNSDDFTQVFITDTQKDRLDPLMNNNIKNNSCFFYIENGNIKQN